MKTAFLSAYYWLDLLVGFGSPILLFALYRRGTIGRKYWRLFWIGALIGAVWEIPFFVMSAHTSVPIVTWIRDFPLHYSVYMVSHTLWDGALFMAGVWLVASICRAPILVRFRWKELAVLMVWGQVSALLVELSAVTNDAWAFVDSYWWNPPLLQIGSHSVTMAMQALWLVAVPIFYFISIGMDQMVASSRRVANQLG